jgi:hypothetical protein
MADTREMITVHSDEILPIEFAPETHGVTKPIEFGAGKRLIYVAPLSELERLENPFGVNTES